MFLWVKANARGREDNVLGLEAIVDSQLCMCPCEPGPVGRICKEGEWVPLYLEAILFPLLYSFIFPFHWKGEIWITVYVRGHRGKVGTDLSLNPTLWVVSVMALCVFIVD